MDDQRLFRFDNNLFSIGFSGFEKFIVLRKNLDQILELLILRIFYCFLY